MPPDDASWLVPALLSAVFAALTAIFAKAGVAGVDPDFATLVRTLVVAVALGAVVVASGTWRAAPAITGRAWAFLALSGLATGASWVFYFRALKAGDAARVAPVDKLSVVLVALFAVAFLGERPAPREWLGIGLVTAGAALVAFPR